MSVDKARSRSKSTGFTIIELLFVIAIVAILISLTLPALAQARLRAKMVESLSLQRQVLGSVALYLMDNDEVFPHLGIEGRVGEGVIHHDGDVLGRDYFQTHLFYWASLIYPQYFGSLNALETDGYNNQSYTQDILGHRRQVRSDFMMSYTVWADAKLWNEEAPKPTVRLLRATRLGEVLFPSEKGLLLDAERGAINQDEFPGYRNLSVGRMDGSAGELDWWSIPEDAVYSNPDWPVMWPYPVLATRDGLAGRDF